MAKWLNFHFSYRFERMTNAEAVASLTRYPVGHFQSLSDRVRRALPMPGLAVPRVRAAYYFSDVVAHPGRYNLGGLVAETVQRNLNRAFLVEWAHAIAISLEADHRHTGRVFIQPREVMDLMRTELVERGFPAIRLGVNDTVDVAAVVARQEGAARLAERHLYYRVDTATAARVMWAYRVNGVYTVAGERSGWFGGWPVRSDQRPRRNSVLRAVPREGEPGHVPRGVSTLLQRLDTAELIQHLPI